MDNNIVLARKAYMALNFDEAYRLFDKVLEADPQNVEGAFFKVVHETVSEADGEIYERLDRISMRVADMAVEDWGVLKRYNTENLEAFISIYMIFGKVSEYFLKKRTYLKLVNNGVVSFKKYFSVIEDGAISCSRGCNILKNKYGKNKEVMAFTAPLWKQCATIRWLCYQTSFIGKDVIKRWGGDFKSFMKTAIKNAQKYDKMLKFKEYVKTLEAD